VRQSDTVTSSQAAASWSPPANRLPGPHDDLTLLSPLGRAVGHEVWAASSARRPGKLVVVEFLPEALPFPQNATGSRLILDLGPWSADGWQPLALVTLLPAALPGPYARFELLSFIGLGGMGQVWMAESPDYPDIALAVKFFTHPVYRRHPALLEQCLQEAKVGISIDSPFVARTYQLLDLRAYQADGWPPVALVMPLYEPSLQRVFDDLRNSGRRLPLNQAVEFARNLLDGLEALHSGHGLVHRDVKPSNVLLRLPDDRPYRGLESLDGATALISDLGTLCRSGERPLFALGQDGWKAPELFHPPGSNTPDGDRAADPAEDLYAFGLVLRALAEAVEMAPGSSEATGEFMPPTQVEEPDDAGLRRLYRIADELTDPDPVRRLAAPAGLRARLSPLRVRGDSSCGSLPGQGESPFPIPHLDHYEILERLGRGGMGLVYKARHRRLQRLVALKVIRGVEHRWLERFRNEATAVARLNHPNIVQIYEIGEVDGWPFLVLEYCSGGNLEEKVGDTPQPAPEAAALVATLARAMRYAHGLGVVHRDLKPSNVLLTADGTPKIADFGLARLVDAEDRLTTRSGVILGTPSYMAPEQARGAVRADGRLVDVYALGAILYELLTGRPPFKGLTVHDTMLQVLSQEPVSPRRLQPGVPRDLETICLKCLAKDPRKRYPGAGELAEDAERFFGGKPILARPAWRGERVWRWSRRNPARAAVAMLLLPLLVGALAVVVLLHYRVTVERDRAHADRVAAARDAAARGDWRRALPWYERAIADDHSDRERLEIERLPGFLAVNDRKRLLDELDRLAARPPPAEDAPIVWLLKGELDLSRFPDRKTAQELIDKAVKSPGRLSAADQAYARALLAPPPKRLSLLQEALRHDRFHHRANRALLLVLATSGEVEAARRRADFMRVVFPDDPFPACVEALTTVLPGVARAVRLLWGRMW